MLSIHSSLSRLTFLFVLLAGLYASPEATAQSITGKYREFPAQGMKFRNLRDFSDVPINDRMKATGLVCQGEYEKVAAVKNTAGKAAQYKPKIFAFWDEAIAPLTGGDAEERKKAKVRRPIDYATTFQQFDLDGVEPEVEEFVSTKRVRGERTTYRTVRSKIEIVVDIYVFQVDRAKLVFVWDYPGDRKTGGRWMRAIEKSMKTLRDLRGDDDEELAPVNSDSSYEDLLAWHKREVAATPGWKLEETKSKNYLIKTNEGSRKNLSRVKKRLAASRKLFEKDFPPPAPITSVSVVRICATRKEFSKYGQTRPGVAGYFNPGSEELVLFFEDGAIEETFGVMTHEAFHQYCHFLFNRSAAHRWFDEGHGDYYGAFILRGSRLAYGEDMVGGLSRRPHLKELLEGGQLKKLSKHIRFNHGAWQNQGPRNISNYCQSFGLISYLRLGADGDVGKKYWNKEYGTILPNYIKELAKGFSEAYGEIVAQATEELEALKEIEEPDQKKIELLTKVIARPFDYFVDQDRRQEIWDNAMDASWGKIDENELEENWLKWLEKVL